MKERNKLAIFDLDGTLFDTKNVNFNAYSRALEACGIKNSIDYQYYREFCNGKNYKVFLPQIIPGISKMQMQEVHDHKKRIYKSYLQLAKKNEHLFRIIDLIMGDYQIALVTTASRENANDILREFAVENKFDFIITQEDVANTKPKPECFIMAMDIAQVSAEDTIIFEDSQTGLMAAEKSGARYVRVYGYN